MEFVVAGCAAVCAGFFTNPLEVLKTRFQLQGELSKKGQHAVHYKNLFHAVYIITKNEGIFALQKGLVPMLGVQFLMNGVRLGSYEYFSSRGFTRDEKGNLIFYKNVILSGIGGLVGSFFASPLYLIKTHLQSQAAQDIAVGYQHHHDGTAHALRKIYNKHGVKGLFRGVGAGIPCVFIASTFQLTSFVYVKNFILKNDICTNNPYLQVFIASMIAGISLSLTVTPFDLIATRIYNQGTDSQGRGLLYKNYLDCFIKVYKLEGSSAFYKGLGANYIKRAPHTVLCLIFWDALNHVFLHCLLGVSSISTLEYLHFGIFWALVVQNCAIILWTSSYLRIADKELAQFAQII